MPLTVAQCDNTVTKLRPWAARLIEVFRAPTYAVRQQWVRNGEKITAYVPASFYLQRRRVKSAADLLPPSAEAFSYHLLGYAPSRRPPFDWIPHRLGLYPMYPDSTVYWVAADLDIHQERGEPDDAYAARRLAGFHKLLRLACGIPSIARRYGVSIWVEISPSGAGVHLWITFVEPVPAAKARRLLWRVVCAAGVDEQMLRGHDGKKFFDAIFPKQDVLSGNLGNLIAAPYARVGLNAWRRVVELKSTFIDADAINDGGDPAAPQALRLSQFLDRVVRHSSQEVEAALQALAADGHIEEPPGRGTIKKRGKHRRSTSTAGRNQRREFFESYTRPGSGVDWRRFLKKNGIPYAEIKDGVLRLVNSCPACGIARHSAWVNANSGWLNCFSDNCCACTDDGGMPPWEWCRLYGLAAPRR